MIRTPYCRCCDPACPQCGDFNAPRPNAQDQARADRALRVWREQTPQRPAGPRLLGLGGSAATRPGER